MTDSSSTEIYNIGGTFRPCGVCHWPSMRLINGKFEQPPGGVTLAWDDDRVTRYCTPHAAGCTELDRPNHPEGKWVTLPPEVVAMTAVEFNGVRIEDTP